MFLIEKSCDSIKPTKWGKITGISLFQEPFHPTIMQGYRKLFSMIEIGKSKYIEKDNNLIQISIDSVDPLFSQMLLSKLINEIDKKLRQKAIKMTTENQEYITSVIS